MHKMHFYSLLLYETKSRVKMTLHFSLVRATGLGLARTARSVFRGSDSPPDCHSLPLPFKSHSTYQTKKQNHKGSALLLGAGDRT